MAENISVTLTDTDPQPDQAGEQPGQDEEKEENTVRFKLLENIFKDQKPQ